jgi:hypothetical protein
MNSPIVSGQRPQVRGLRGKRPLGERGRGARSSPAGKHISPANLFPCSLLQKIRFILLDWISYSIGTACSASQ